MVMRQQALTRKRWSVTTVARWDTLPGNAGNQRSQIIDQLGTSKIRREPALEEPKVL